MLCCLFSVVPALCVLVRVCVRVCVCVWGQVMQMVWSCSRRFSQFNCFFIMQITLLWDTLVCVCVCVHVCVCDCVHVFVLISDWSCQFNETLNNPSRLAETVFNAENLEVRSSEWSHHIGLRSASEHQISSWIIIKHLSLYLFHITFPSPAPNFFLCLLI